MRYTEKELAQFGCRSSGTIEGRLHYRPPSGNFSQSAFKERWCKLTSNFLFYFRINELGVIDVNEPSGVLVLEHAHVQAEELSGGLFAFAVTFADDPPDRKHLFSARSEDQVQQWVAAIKACSYEYWRGVLRALQGKIKRRTGKDPLLMFPHNESIASKDPLSSLYMLSITPDRPWRSPNRKVTSFKSHLSSTESNASSSQNIRANPSAQSFQTHLNTISASPNLFPNRLSTSIFGTNTDISVLLPAPPRPSRSGNKKTQSVQLQATREAPLPPCHTSNSNCDANQTSEQNLIEF